MVVRVCCEKSRLALSSDGLEIFPRKHIAIGISILVLTSLLKYLCMVSNPFLTILDYFFPFNRLSTWEVNLYSIGMYMKADLLFFLCHNPTSIKGVTALLDLCELHFLWQSVANDGHKRSFVIYALLANFYWSLWSSVKKYGKTFSFFVCVCRSF